jgi:23S rRNA pseudouridine1911/1915/1917 synthase
VSTQERTAWTATVSVNEAGTRLDSLVAAHAGCSRARARELLDLGMVEVEGRPVHLADKGRIMSAGERVRVRVAAAALDRIVPEPVAPLVVLAEGEGWVAVDKPAGVAVHPLRADEQGTLLQRVAARWPEIEGVGEGGRRSGVVHRLDVDTSGVQVFALAEPAWQWWRAGFREHRIEKVYRALVRGVPEHAGEVELDLVIAAHRPARVRVARAGEAGSSTRACRTSWTVLERYGVSTLVEVRPLTGFLHQVRVTFAHLGHPLLGDAVYGGLFEASAAPRHLLHASALSFEDVAVSSPDPPDFRAVLDRLRIG